METKGGTIKSVRIGPFERAVETWIIIALNI